jgi:hypothetical protein
MAARTLLSRSLFQAGEIYLANLLSMELYGRGYRLQCGNCGTKTNNGRDEQRSGGGAVQIFPSPPKTTAVGYQVESSRSDGS